MRQGACAWVTRDAGRAFLAFRHPRAGNQLVKGGIRPGECAEVAALRELIEEAVIPGQSARLLCRDDGVQSGELWHLCDVATGLLPARWTHLCAHDGGHRFRFFWHPVDAAMDGFDARFRRAAACALASAI